jgi:hypothetical protein
MANRLASAAFIAGLTVWEGQARADEVPRRRNLWAPSRFRS